jgi:hypothetical protein
MVVLEEVEDNCLQVVTGNTPPNSPTQGNGGGSAILMVLLMMLEGEVELRQLEMAGPGAAGSGGAG